MLAHPFPEITDADGQPLFVFSYLRFQSTELRLQIRSVALKTNDFGMMVCLGHVNFLSRGFQGGLENQNSLSAFDYTRFLREQLGFEGIDGGIYAGNFFVLIKTSSTV